MTMLRRRALLLFLWLGFGAVAIAGGRTVQDTGGGPAPEESAVFVTRHEGEPVAVERVTRSRGRVSGRMVVNAELEVSWTLDVSPEQVTRSFDLRTRASEEPEQALHGELSPASTAAVGGASPAEKTGRPEPAEAALFDQSIGMVEQIVRRARAKNGGQVAVRRIIGSRPLTATVRFPTEDRAEVELGGRTYDLVVDGAGRILAGQLTDYGVTFQRLASAPEAAFAMRPRFAAPAGAPYRAVNVEIPTPQGHVLAGTLTVPTGNPGRAPAVVLITGLTKHDRNNGNAPSFRQLADALSRRGVAVLRVDDRGVGASTGDAGVSTTQDEAADVRAALMHLRTRSEIDGARLGLIGYSEGGLIAAMVAAEEPGLRAIVGLAAPASALESAEYQLGELVDGNGSVPAESRDAMIRAELRKEREKPRERSFLDLDARVFARRVAVPVLLVQGTTDRHVPPWAASQLASAFQAGGDTDVTVRLVPGLNHLLLPDPDGRRSGWLFLPSFSIPATVLNGVAEWTAARLN